MKTLANEAYNFYKGLSPEGIILFHLDGRYIVLNDDAELISQLIPDLTKPDAILEGAMAIPKSNYIEALSRLGDHGVLCNSVTYRNQQNKLDFPDVRLILQETEEDY